VLEKQGHIDLFYGDESRFCLTAVMAYCWQYPKEQVRILLQRSKRINVFGLMSGGNKLLTFIREGTVKSDFIVDSIEGWAKSLTKPTGLVLDNAPIHQAKLLKAKLAEWQEQNLFIFFLPTYSPHLNNIEHLWRKIKYEWLRPESYLSLEILKAALGNIFEQFGNTYSINFKQHI
jgi:transposase